MGPDKINHGTPPPRPDEVYLFWIRVGMLSGSLSGGLSVERETAVFRCIHTASAVKKASTQSRTIVDDLNDFNAFRVSTMSVALSTKAARSKDE